MAVDNVGNSVDNQLNSGFGLGDMFVDCQAVSIECIRFGNIVSKIRIRGPNYL